MTKQIKPFKILSKNFLKIFFILLTLSTSQLFSQGQISGNVKDSDGIPLPGATIVEEGTLNGTSTDFDGNFTLTLENDESDILVSFVGYITETYPVEDGAVINASLSIDGGSLDEVVVTGFGTSQQ